tara:strand:- start:211 stop:540 length:330 start_codon:yes stop_codon:yes gene_type:complete
LLKRNEKYLQINVSRNNYGFNSSSLYNQGWEGGSVCSSFKEILVMTKANKPDCLFFNITTCESDKAYVREAYKDGAAALCHLKNIGHMILKLFEVSDITVQVQGPRQGD